MEWQALEAEAARLRRELDMKDKSLQKALARIDHLTQQNLAMQNEQRMADVAAQIERTNVGDAVHQLRQLALPAEVLGIGHFLMACDDNNLQALGQALKDAAERGMAAGAAAAATPALQPAAARAAGAAPEARAVHFADRSPAHSPEEEAAEEDEEEV